MAATSNLPHQSTSFIGRAEELAGIAALLVDPNCRLLTLVGPGGIGKTRLALQAANEQIPHYLHGVYFVPLQPLTSPDLIPSAIASALKIIVYGVENPLAQIITYLREKHTLLVMDSFEHVLEGTALLTDVLVAAPDVKILTTSRERLNIQEEWTLGLEGLAYPTDSSTTALETYSAVQLFLQRARQTQVHFSLDENAEAVKTICQRVEGMPLGLELAATWLRALSCSQIAARLGSGLDLLTTPLRNVPERHRSLRAVFEQSWQLLSDAERDVLMRLAVFHGGFDLEAAEQVAGATLVLLAGLTDKSLIRLSAAGRYDLHELLRQFSADQLEQARQATVTSHRHLDYFLKLAEQAEAHVYGREQLVWFDRLEIELNNLRGALTWSINGGEAELGLCLATALGWFYQYRAHWQEGQMWLERLLALTPDDALSTRAKALHRIGEFAGVIGDLERSNQFCLEGLALARQVNDQKMIAWSLSALGFWSQDWQVLDESLAMFRTLDDPFGLSHALRRRAAWSLDHQQQDYAYVRVLLDEALRSAREAGDGNAIAWVLLLLGLTIWGQDRDARQTAALFEGSLSAFLEIRNVAEACAPLILLGHVEQVAGNTMRFRELYHRALILLRDLGSNAYGISLLSVLLTGLGNFAGRQGEWEQAAKLLAAAEEGIPGFFGFLPRPEFDRLVASVRAQSGEAVFAAAWAEGKAMAREQAIAYALECETPTVETPPIQHKTNQPLPEPLSVRELDVLRLMAEGLSNSEIAHKLFISIATVKVHAGNIYGKLSVTNRTQAVIRAQELDLL